MKLSKIYCNKPEIFETINFETNLNVIFAKVYNPKKTEQDSHNLGKTLLISLLNFMFLSELSSKHFLMRNYDKFEAFIFYLELKLDNGKYITIKRGVKNDTKISFKFHEEEKQNYSNLPDSSWNEKEVTIKKAKILLDEKLNFKLFEDPWTYRHGITYFLRDQNDWNDLFMISKFQKNQHQYWKPYLIKLFGFDDKKVLKKYKIDDEISNLNTTKEQLQTYMDVTTGEYDKLKGQIEIKENDLKILKKQIDRFNFFKDDIEANTNLVKDIEFSISLLNDELYTIKYELTQINNSLVEKTDFDLEKVTKIFSEVQIQFKDSLKKDLNDLISFNKKITSDRYISLNYRMLELQELELAKTEELKNLNTVREEKLTFLEEHDSFKKYKVMQNQIVILEANLINLKIQLTNMDKLSKIENQIHDKEKEVSNLVKEIDHVIKGGNEQWRLIRLTFNEIVKSVLDCDALLSIKLNKQGNPEFEFGILNSDEEKKITSQSEGTSYKKLLCAAFDLAILKTFSKEEFYHFAYHDGILEGLDNRKKKKFLEKLNQLIKENDLQYILTLIEDDLPRDENDKKIYFSKDVIIKELHDKGNEGRLFKMPIF